MKKVLIAAAAAAGMALVARRAAAHCAEFDVERLIDRMPENSPPKWMFRNVSEIRANTERILELLAAEPTGADETRERATAA